MESSGLTTLLIIAGVLLVYAVIGIYRNEKGQGGDDSDRDNWRR